MYNKILCLVREKCLSFFLKWGGGNQPVSLFCNNGTSETASDITFQFNNYFNLKPLHKKKLDLRFLEWFIGFTEGVGSRAHADARISPRSRAGRLESFSTPAQNYL